MPLQIVVNVADDTDANAVRFQCAQYLWSIRVRVGCPDIAVPTPDGKRELVVEASQSKLEQCCRLMQVSGAVGSLTRGKDPRMLGRIAKLTGQAQHIVVVNSLSNGGHTGADPG